MLHVTLFCLLYAEIERHRSRLLRLESIEEIDVLSFDSRRREGKSGLEAIGVIGTWMYLDEYEGRRWGCVKGCMREWCKYIERSRGVRGGGKN